MSEPYRNPRRGYWKSLLNVLSENDIPEQDVVLVEAAPGDIWEFAFWSDNPDGFPVTYRCRMGRSIWEPVETPAYTGEIRPYDRETRGGHPYHGDPDPK